MKTLQEAFNAVGNSGVVDFNIFARATSSSLLPKKFDGATLKFNSVMKPFGFDTEKNKSDVLGKFKALYTSDKGAVTITFKELANTILKKGDIEIVGGLVDYINDAGGKLPDELTIVEVRPKKRGGDYVFPYKAYPAYAEENT